MPRNDEEDNKSYIERITKAANQGDAEAQYELGKCYEKGIGVKQNLMTAENYYNIAAPKNVSAQLSLGDMYFVRGAGGIKEIRNKKYLDEENNESLKKAVDWYRKATNAGNLVAQTKLGVCYENGQGVKKDEKAALELYRKAAEKGYAKAQYYLGLNYEKGIGVERNQAKALEWYKAAATQNDKNAKSAILRLELPEHQSPKNTKPIRSALKSPRNEKKVGKEKRKVNFGEGEASPGSEEAPVGKDLRKDIPQLTDRLFDNTEIDYELGKKEFESKEDATLAASEEDYAKELKKDYNKNFSNKYWRLLEKNKIKTELKAELEQVFKDRLEEKVEVKLSKNNETLKEAIKLLVSMVKSFSQQGFGKEMETLITKLDLLAKGTNEENRKATYLECFKELQEKVKMISENMDGEYSVGLRVLALEMWGELTAKNIEIEEKYHAAVLAKSSAPIASSSAVQQPTAKTLSTPTASSSTPSKSTSVSVSAPSDKENEKELLARMSLNLLLREASNGKAAAQNEYGNRLMSGRDVDKNVEEAISWYDAAAKIGNMDAQYNLGRIYEEGVGSVVKDANEAIKWFELAAKQNSKEAIKGLERLRQNKPKQEEKYGNESSVPTVSSSTSATSIPKSLPIATPSASIAPTMTSAAPVSSASPASSVPSSSKKPKVKKTKLSQKAKHELQVLLSNVLKYNFSDDHPFKNDIIKMNLKIRNRKGWIYDDKYENEVEARKDVESVVKLQKGLLELDVNIVRSYIKNEIKKNAKKLIKYFDYLNFVYVGKPINIEKTDTKNKISSLIAEAAKKANDLKNDVVNKSVQGIKNQWLEYTEAMNKVEAAWENYEKKYLRSLPLPESIVPSATLTSRPVTSVAASISTSSAFTAASSAAAPKTLAPTPAPSVPTAAPSTPILELQKEIADLTKKVEEKSADEKDRTRLAAAKSDLGRFYYDGIGVKKDYQKAFELFIDAANLGNIDAIYNLGLCYQQGNAVDINFEVAFEIFNKAAQKGHIGAINSIGICYSKGIGVEQNDGLAAKAFEKAAKGGNADAQFDLAESYYNGTGIEENEEQALKWYQLSAAQGNAKAQYKLGYFYEHGREPHVKKNINQAIEWYKKAEKSDSDSVFANFAKIALQKLAASSPSEISTDGSIPKPLAVNASLEKKRDNKSSTVSSTQTRPDVLEEGSIEITLKTVETPEPVLTSKPRESKEDKPRKTQTAPLGAKPSASEPSVRPKKSEKRPDLYAFKKDQLEARQQHLAEIKKTTMEKTKGHSTQPITFEDYKEIHEKSKAQLLRKISEEGKREGSPYFNVSVAETQPMDLKVLIPNESGGNDILTRSFKEKDDNPEVEVTLSGNSENAIFQMIATNSDPKLRPLELDPGSDPETILKILETAKEAGWEIPKDLNHKDYEKTLSEDPRYQDRYEKVLSVGPSPDSDDEEGLGVTIHSGPKTK